MFGLGVSRELGGMVGPRRRLATFGSGRLAGRRGLCAGRHGGCPEAGPAARADSRGCCLRGGGRIPVAPPPQRGRIPASGGAVWRARARAASVARCGWPLGACRVPGGGGLGASRVPGRRRQSSGGAAWRGGGRSGHVGSRAVAGSGHVGSRAVGSVGGGGSGHVGARVRADSGHVGSRAAEWRGVSCVDGGRRSPRKTLRVSCMPVASWSTAACPRAEELW